MFYGKPFGHWLKEYRNAHGLTRVELALRVGCSPEMIHKIELGQRRPSRQIAELLADAVHIGQGEREDFIDFARSSVSQSAAGPGSNVMQSSTSKARTNATNPR